MGKSNYMERMRQYQKAGVREFNSLDPRLTENTNPIDNTAVSGPINFLAEKEKPLQKPVSSGLLTKGIRNVAKNFGVPLAGRQLIASTITRDNKFGMADAPEGVQNHLISSVMKARNRTGKNKGGTQYIDYNQNVHNALQNMKTDELSAVVGSYTADDFIAATTFGRVSYDYDPKTKEYKVYDSYDFSKLPSKSNRGYNKLREVAGEVGVSDKGSKRNLIGTFKEDDYKDLAVGNEYGNVTEGISYLKSFKEGGLYKYQPGGMRMYGDPKLGDQTFANIVYQESEAGKQEALKKQMEEAQADNTAMEEANAALQRQYAIGNRVEASGQTALQAGAQGLKNLVTPEVGKTVAKEVGKAAADPLLGQTPNWAAAMVPNAAGETASLASGTAAAAATDVATDAATKAAFTPSVVGPTGTNLASKSPGMFGKLGQSFIANANPQHFAKVSPYAIAGNLAGRGISYFSDDNDATTMNFGEGAGGVISGAASGAGFGSILGPVGTAVGAGVGALYGLGKGIYQRNKARNTIGAAEREKANELNTIGANMRAEGVNSRSYSGYDFGRTLAKHGGVRLPGGTMNPIPGSDAVEFKGKSHKQGGILLDEQTEVEGGETMDKVTMKNEGPSDYFFSKYLKLGGRSYAQRHKDILKKGGTQQDIDALAMSQEKTAGRNPGIIQMERGGFGVRKYQYAGPYTYTPMNPMLPNYKMTVGVPELQLPGSGNQVDYLAGIRNRNNKTNTQSAQSAQTTGVDPRMYGPFAPVDNTYVDVNTKLPPYSKGVPSVMGLLQQQPSGYFRSTPGNFGKLGEYENAPAAQTPTSTNTSTSTAPEATGAPLPTAGPVDEGQVMFDNEQEAMAGLQSLPTIDTSPAAKEKSSNDDLIMEDVNAQIADLEAKRDSVGLTKDEQKALNNLYRDVPLGAYAAGAAQMIPAAYAFLRKEKAQKLMGPAGRIGAPKLERADFNKERSQNASDARALNKSIETSGSGPAGIIAKMAAFKRKQDGDMQIATAETRANAGIQAEEAQMKQQADLTNVQNALAIDNVNTAMMENQRVADENRKYMALDKLANASSGLMGDVMSYKANERMARAIGSMGIYEREKLLNSMLGKTNPRTGKPYNRNDIAELYNISLEDDNLLQEAQTSKDMENMSVYERAMAVAAGRQANGKQER